MNVIVTGAASGIGHAICELFYDEGHDVIGVDLKIAGGKYPVFERDVRNDICLHDPLRQFGLTNPIDGLVNCAGVSGRRAFQYMDREEWDRVLNVNLWGTANCCQQFLRHVLSTGPAHGGQWITNIGSMTGFIGNGRGFTNAHYAASKAGVVGLTKALAIEFAEFGIRVNAVCPGPVNTPMIMSFRESKPDLFREFIDRIPLGLGKPEDVAQAVLYLAEAEWTTGSVLMTDGGYTSA